MTKYNSSNQVANLADPPSQLRVALISILLVYVLLSFFCWGRVTDIIVDRGFEIYLAWRMNHGEMPIRDYYLLVPPGSYQINALLFRCFGDDISILLAAGAINGLVFVLLLFGVLRRVTTLLIAWSVAVSTILISIFSDSIFNFVFPYTFAMPYASSAFMGSLLALLSFIESRRRSKLLLSGLLYGLSICLKYEFVLFGAVVFFTPIVIRFKGRHWLVQTLLSAAMPIILSLVLLSAEGVGIQDWVRFIEWFKSFVSSPLLLAFYKRVGVYSFDPLIQYFSAAIGKFAIFALIISVWVYLDKSRINPTFKVLSFGLLLAVCISDSWDKALGFLWLGLVSLSISLVAISYLAVGPGLASGGGKSLVVLLSFLLAGVKTLAAPVVAIYGSIFWPYYWGAIFVSLGLLHARSRSPIFIGLRRGVPIILIAISISLFIKDTLPSIVKSDAPLFSRQVPEESRLNHATSRLNTIRAPRRQVDAVTPFIEEINRLRKRDSSLLVLPEGTMLNFILRMPGAAGFHNLSPTFFFSYGEDFVLTGIKNSAPHFILRNKDARGEHKPYVTFGVHYSQKTVSEIASSYCRVFPVSIDAAVAESGFELWSNRREDCERVP